MRFRKGFPLITGLEETWIHGETPPKWHLINGRHLFYRTGRLCSRRCIGIGLNCRASKQGGGDDTFQSLWTLDTQFFQNGRRTIDTILPHKLQRVQGGDEIGHVFNDTQDGYFSLLTKVEFFSHVGQTNFFRCGDDQGPGRGSGLGQEIDCTNVFITSPRRCIYNQIIQSICVPRPIDVQHELLNEGIFPWSPPDDGLVGILQEKGNGHHGQITGCVYGRPGSRS
mmetsp:Transcript_7948/g.15440  ORF Transcript_7948/g.15440 Transcript_7948/m.15440 type:complete len:225 (+) Transcript_7948:215-889(+)